MNAFSMKNVSRKCVDNENRLKNAFSMNYSLILSNEMLLLVEIIWNFIVYKTLLHASPKATQTPSLALL